MIYTNIPKPIGTNYTNLNAAKPTYDEMLFSYDDSNMFYDGFNPNQYTNLAKPVLTGGYLGFSGLTYTGNAWTNINKPI